MQLKDVSTTTDSSSLDESVVNSFLFPEESQSSHKTVLYQELRLIERNENEINVCWKGAHMMLFFMAFVFGSLCTCCIHRLKSMFGDKCVLYPKVVTYSTVNRMLYEFFSFKSETENMDSEMAPVEFVTTKWSDNSVCYLPTYVPLVSGLAGLVWTTMFLMCSSGTTHNVTGAQRHWRALPIMFLFSGTMAGLCIYTSTVTQRGLENLCSKLAEVTGSPRCGYTINVVTLTYDRRIRGVYQATLLSIASAWLHTICWLLSTLLIVLRVLLAVDFTLVHVKAHLFGNVEDILQKHERQIHSFNVDSGNPYKSDIDEEDSEQELYTTTNTVNKTSPQAQRPINRRLNKTNDLIKPSQQYSSQTTQDEQRLYEKQSHELLLNLLKNIRKSKSHTEATTSSLKTQKDQAMNTDVTKNDLTEEIAERLARYYNKKLLEKVTQEFSEFEYQMKFNLKSKDNNRDTRSITISDQSDNKKISSNVTNKLEYKKTEHEKSASTQNGNNEAIQPKRSHAVQFYDQPTIKGLNDETNENPKIDDVEDENKNKENSTDKDELQSSDELQISHDKANDDDDDDKLASSSKIKSNDENQDKKEDVDNVEHKSDAINKVHRSGELQILDDTNNASNLDPNNEKTNTDQEEKKNK